MTRLRGRRVTVLAALACVPSLLDAQTSLRAMMAATPDTSVHLAFGGFVDTYFAYDFDRPPELDRAFTTQAARHDEFNINLAFIDATLTGPRLRGRLAVQYGTSVQVNAAGEPRVGAISGPDVSRFVQEATLGYQVARSVWIDGGIFLAPFGNESWISRDNWTYTHSLIGDYSPTYEAGVKATWRATPALTAQLHVMNGWQNISETNSDKAVAARIDYAPASRVALAYDVFVGNEAPDSARRQLRVFNEVMATTTLTSRLQLRGTFDYGTQHRATGSGDAVWRGFAVLAHVQAAPALALTGRVEQFSDPEQVVAATDQPSGLRATGTSLTLTVVPTSRLLWRVETRWLWARDAVFPDRATASGLSTRDGVVLSSLALTM